MKTVLVFGASNSKQSINRQFAIHAAHQLKQVQLNIVDLNDYASPLYSVDLEREIGVHQQALQFHQAIQQSDAIIISVAEYNGLHTSAFKNLWDWLSRIPSDQPFNIWGGKPMLLLSASPSRRPMNNVMKVSRELFPHFGANIVAHFYLPSFNHLFDGQAINEPNYRQSFLEALEKFQAVLSADTSA